MVNVIINTALQRSLIAAYNASLAASNVLIAAKKEFDDSLAADLALQGLGKGALVLHVHVHAHHGNASDKEVVSQVVNVYGNPAGKVLLRVQLGNTRGQLSVAFASVALLDVISVVKPSHNPFRE